MLDGLRPPAAQKGNLSPTAGFAWTVDRDGKTVVRGGVGRYFDPAGSTNAPNLINERHLLSPIGTGSLTRTGANILHDGRPLEFLRPTPFTGADVVAILPSIRADLLRTPIPAIGTSRFATSIAPRKVRISTTRTTRRRMLSTPVWAFAARARATPRVGADVVWKRLSSIRSSMASTTTVGTARAVRSFPGARRSQNATIFRPPCSNGAIYFDTTIGRARYVGLLVRAEKRLSRRTQFLASYALGSFVGSNGTGTGTAEAPGGRVFGFNNDNWFENYGPLPTDQRHVLNLSGFVELPWQFQLAVGSSASARRRYRPTCRRWTSTATARGNDLLPGTSINQFGPGSRQGRSRAAGAGLQPAICRQADGRRPASAASGSAGRLFVQRWFLHAGPAPDPNFSLGRNRLRSVVFVEVFNLLNTPNLVGFGMNLRQAGSFGQPTARFSQVFGSGGPRAFQLGARVTF